MDIHFGVEWFENVHNFGVVGTGIRGVQNSVKYGRYFSFSGTGTTVSILNESVTARYMFVQ